MHEAKLATLSAKPEVISPSDFLEALNDHYEDYIDSLLEYDQIIESNQINRFRLKFVTALRHTFNIMFAKRSKLKRIYKNRIALARQNQAQPFEIPATYQAEVYQGLVDKRPWRPLKASERVWIFGITFLLFTLSFVLLFSYEYLLALILVLFIHEMGHFLVMKAFGYQNVTLFFLPFMGAAVTGEKNNETLIERFLILMAGPLPGLIIGFGMLYSIIYFKMEFSPFKNLLALTFIFLNFINLLPIVPLDGGRIVDRLFFNSKAYTGALFKGFAVIAFVGLGYWLGNPIIYFLALLVGLSIRSSFQTTRDINQLYNHLQNQNQPQSISTVHIFTALQETGLDTLEFGKKCQLVNGLKHSLSKPNVPVRTRLILFSLYLITLIGSPFLYWLWRSLLSTK